MSRSDLRQAEYDYSIYGDGRDFHAPMPPSHAGGQSIHSTNKGPPSAPRDTHRDIHAREFASTREPTAYYQSGPSMGLSSHSSLGDSGGGRGGDGGGYPAGMGVSQRMYGGVPGQPARIVTGGEGWGSGAPGMGPNSSRQPGAGAAPPNQVQLGGGQQPSLSLNHHHHRESPPRPPLPYPAPHSAQAPFSVDRDRDNVRDAYYTSRHPAQTHPQHQSISSPHPLGHPPPLSSPTSSQPPRSTLWWGELEPWMDEEYAKQVCNLMGWDPVNIKVPRPAPDPASGRQVANNPGYCFLTFPSQNHAASVLAQINNANNSTTMPNSSRPFTLNWASSVPNAPINGASPFPTTTITIPGAQNPQYPKEYSIFVGDLAPEVSNSDLVAVFRNPVLGLRNDREPRFIRPFLSCKSAKIMLDPVTGVSRGYGFVRFTDEPDQQRALIEMHGLYCLSRPMRISPATAKFKSAPGMPGVDLAQMYAMGGQPQPSAEQVAVALPLPSTNQTKSVSAPLASPVGVPPASGSAASLGTTSNSGSSLNGPSSISSSSTLATASSDETSTSNAAPRSSPNTTAANASINASLDQQLQDQLMAQRFSLSEESWKHHAQARAILSNLIGPNGEQLTSSDPYNTTVFVGGLSPLISEETLRTFFAPFGDIHYVKVPVGKHCGFVQFVRKPDAERAIEKMQGFPIGGSRIRLSWGRSQYKAAQAAAQAAQAAALQAQFQMTPSPSAPAPAANPLTAEQAMQLLEKFGIAQFLNNSALPEDDPTNGNGDMNMPQNINGQGLSVPYDTFDPSFDGRQANGQFGGSAFSPFSPDPNYLAEGMKNMNMHVSQPHPQQYSYEPKTYAPWYPAPSHEDKSSSNGSGKVSPTSGGTSRPSSSNRFGSYLMTNDNSGGSPFQQNRASSRQEAPIARPDLTKRPSQVGLTNDHVLQDLNGALASLELDHTHWKSSAVDIRSALPTTP